MLLFIKENIHLSDSLTVTDRTHDWLIVKNRVFILDQCVCNSKLGHVTRLVCSHFWYRYWIALQSIGIMVSATYWYSSFTTPHQKSSSKFVKFLSYFKMTTEKHTKAKCNLLGNKPYSCLLKQHRFSPGNTYFVTCPLHMKIRVTVHLSEG